MAVSSLYENIFNTSPVGIVMLGEEGQVLHYNHSFKILAQAAMPLINNPIFSLFLSSDKTVFKNRFTELLQGKYTSFSLDLQYRHKSGVPGWMHIIVNLTTPLHSTERYLIAYADDITEKKTHDFQLLEAKENSEKAQETAERAVKTKSDFLANMSHEIRTPIHTIIGMSELLSETKLDPEQQEYSGQIQFSADVLLELVNDILDFSKIEAGKLTLEEVPFNLLTIAENAVSMIALEAHKKGLETAVFVENDVPCQVMGDPTRLRQIIVNLFNNAVKFTHKGSIIVTMKLEKDFPSSVRVKVCVTDTGIGIPDDKKERLFKVFSQVDSTTTRKYGGTGLGLSISKNLAEMMGGSIGVESTENKGSLFWFIVELKKQNGEPQKELKIPLDLRVLLVDDNITVRGFLKKYLVSWGCEVFETADGKSALSFLRNEKKSHIDLCLIDLVLPGMDGWQLASEIHSDKEINGVKRILLSPSGKSGEEAKMKLLNWFSGYLHKPVKKYVLLREILKVFNREEEFSFEEGVEEEEDVAVLTEEIAGAAILVAEDHRVNQLLFKTILENLGHDVTLASNGREAVESVKKKVFDIIFMDVQMPEMNGYEATEEIRRMKVKTPIIAVTASALKGEKEKCIVSGMTDFLPKPFKKKDLLPVLERWLEVEDLEIEEIPDVETLEEVDETGKGFVESDTDKGDGKGDTSGEEIFDFNTAVEVFMGEKELVLKLINDLLPRIERQLADMERYNEEKDFNNLRAESHSIKGSCANMSIHRVASQAALLEKASVEQSSDTGALLSNLKKAYWELVSYVKEQKFFTG